MWNDKNGIFTKDGERRNKSTTFKIEKVKMIKPRCCEGK